MKLEEVVKKHMVITLMKCGFSTTLASKELGVSRSCIYRKLKQWGIDFSDKRKLITGVIKMCEENGYE